MLESKQITKSYGDLPVLRGVNFCIAKGEIVSIVGASGAGKTTFLQILGTLERPDGGQLLFEGELLQGRSDRELAQFRNHKLGFVFQFHHLMAEFSALENVMMPAFIGGNARDKAQKRAQELLNFMGLNERASHKPGALSGGEQQRVAVARALMNKPRVVLADEPTGNLDSQNAAALHELFDAVRREFGTSFVIITHNRSLAATADRMLTMEDGAIKEG